MSSLLGWLSLGGWSRFTLLGGTQGLMPTCAVRSMFVNIQTPACGERFPSPSHRTTIRAVWKRLARLGQNDSVETVQHPKYSIKSY